MKTDLKNTTFIIPLRIDTGDRLRNVILSTSFITFIFFNGKGKNGLKIENSDQ